MPEIYTHTHTHTPISVAEKIFKVSFREAMSVCSWSNFLCGKRFFIGDRGLIKGGFEMRKFSWLLSLMLILPLICVAQIEEEPTASENPDEYRDCVVYTLEQADAATAPTGNQLIFTYSGFMTRAEGDNSDCGIISYIDAPSSEGGSGDSNGGGSIVGGGGSSSGNGGGSGSSSGNGGGSGSSSGNGGSSSGDNSGDGTPSGSLLPGRPPSQPSYREDGDSVIIPGVGGEAGEDELS